MTSGVIQNGSFPMPIPLGLIEACEAALEAASLPILVTRAPDGLHVSDVAIVAAIISSYTGSTNELLYRKTRHQDALDVFFDSHFDLAAFIRGGLATGVTAANVGTFLAAITNNYRSLRAQIAAAANVAEVNAINVQSGWPSSP